MNKPRARDAGTACRRLVNRNNVFGKASTLFLLPIAGTKEKAKQKENAVWGEFRRLRAATKATRLGCAPPFEKGGRKLQNRRGAVVRLTFLPTLSPGEDLALR